MGEYLVIVVLFIAFCYNIFAVKNGSVAQQVEQRTENPCVAGSIPAGTTIL